MRVLSIISHLFESFDEPLDKIDFDASQQYQKIERIARKFMTDVVTAGGVLEIPPETDDYTEIRLFCGVAFIPNNRPDMIARGLHIQQLSNEYHELHNVSSTLNASSFAQTPNGLSRLAAIYKHYPTKFSPHDWITIAKRSHMRLRFAERDIIHYAVDDLQSVLKYADQHDLYPWKELESFLISTGDPDLCAAYAAHDNDGHPWPEAEDIIVTDLSASLSYLEDCRHVDRWPAFEKRWLRSSINPSAGTILTYMRSLDQIHEDLCEKFTNAHPSAAQVKVFDRWIADFNTYD